MPRPSLQTGLDKDIYHIIRKYQEERPDSELKAHLIYNYLQRSNSALKRRPKNVLESSITRVISVIRSEEDKTESEMSEPPPQPINRFIVSSMITNGVRPNDREKTPKKRKRKDETQHRPEDTNVAESRYRIEDLGGVEDVLEQFSDLLVLPLTQPEIYHEARVEVPRGVLLHGPPGCGKSVMSRAFAAELGVPFVEILGPSVVSGMSGESEQKIREKFDEARLLAPCLLFIDEIDAIAPKRDSSGSQMEKRIVAQLLLSMDSLDMRINNGKPVIVLAATNRPDSLDPALRRGGRFDLEVTMGVPTERMREQILRAQTRELNLSEDIDFRKLAKMTAGFVGADLKDMISKAWAVRFRKYRQELQANVSAEGAEMDIDYDSAQNTAQIPEAVRKFKRFVARCKDKSMRLPDSGTLSLDMAAFLTVLPKIIPSSKREGFATVPDTTWRDIGALEDIRRELTRAIVHPIAMPEKYEAVGIKPPTGVLLWGPPGCGKTLLAKAVANESKANFISVKGPELFNKYLGESERSVRQVFTRARSSIPCVLFFDELDGLVPSREGGGGNEASARVVNTLLTELDGLDSRDGIYVIAATNRPDIIDPAMLRPGRLEKLLYVGLPGASERVSILQTLIARTPIDKKLAGFARGECCAKFSGADLESLLRQAGLAALERNATVVDEADFIYALTKVRSSVQSIERYERLKVKLQSH